MRTLKNGLIVVLATLTYGNLWAFPWESASEKAKVDNKIAEVESVIQKGAFKDDWDSLRKHETPEWYQDAKFGIFIHWGLYSVPGYANEWYSRNMYQQGDDAFKHHVATYGPQSKFGYKDFIPQFKAEKFDPSHWAKLFKEAGAQYVVPVAEHHDGFAMYKSDLSRWTAFNMGPKRDLIGALSKAVRAEGLVCGASSHRAEHWWFMSGGMKFDSDMKNLDTFDFYGPAEADYSSPSEEYARNWLARSCELVDNYKPQLIYFDWWVGETPVFAPYLKKFAAYYYNRAAEWGLEVVLNTKDKAFVPGTAVQDVEKGKLPGINPVSWQTDTSISWRSWAYLKDDQLKDSGYLIRTLIDAVSKNGNLLLDIGPKPDGTIPEEQEKVLKEIGLWLKVNGEAIYGTRPWVLNGEGPTRDTGGKNSETDVKYQEGDVRFTRKGSAVYVFSMAEAAGPLTISGLGEILAPGATIKDIALLGSGEKVKWERTGWGLILPADSGNKGQPLVYRVTLDGLVLGGFKTETTAKGFTAKAVLQNYSADKAVKVAALLVSGKKEASDTVSVDAKSSGSIEIPFETSSPGLYSVSLTLPGLGSLGGRATLPAIDLTGEWLFKKGDDLSWSKPSLDDKVWQKVQLPAHWEDHSQYTADNVYGWYRKKITIPAAWKGHSILLPVGKIDDTDATYFNGRKIGQTGEFPPHFQGFWDKPRKYEVPAKLIRFGKENVIAIRVFDAYGGGGLYDGPLGPIEVK